VHVLIMALTKSAALTYMQGSPYTRRKVHFPEKETAISAPGHNVNIKNVMFVYYGFRDSDLYCQDSSVFKGPGNVFSYFNYMVEVYNDS